MNYQFGLRELDKDLRDFQLGWIVDLPPLEDLPDDFVLEPLGVKDQLQTDFCAAFSAATISELQEKMELSPEYIFAKAKQLIGDYKGWGLTLREVSNALLKFGSLKQKDSPHSVRDKERDFLANWENWPKGLDEKAKEHKKQSYFAVKGKYDDFDNIRASIWFYREKKKGVIMGLMWGYSLNQVILKQPTEYGFGHAVSIIGWRNIEGIPYLVAVNSYGKSAGENGFHYLSRELVNKWVGRFGAFMFIDENSENIKREYWPLWIKIWDWLKTFIRRYVKI